MSYDVTVNENPAHEGIMRLPLNIIYFLVSCWQVTRCTFLWCDTNGSFCLQKELVKADTVSNTALLHNRVIDLNYLKPIAEI